MRLNELHRKRKKLRLASDAAKRIAKDFIMPAQGMSFVTHLDSGRPINYLKNPR